MQEERTAHLETIGGLEEQLNDLQLDVDDANAFVEQLQQQAL